MPLFFFSLHNHVLHTDDVGVELADVRAARIEAIRFIGEVLRGEPELLDETQKLEVHVEDEARRERFHITIEATDATG